MPGAPGLEYAGALPRLAALVVDTVIIGVAASIAAAPFVPAVTHVTQANGFWASTTSYAVRSGVGSLVTVAFEAAYFTLLWMSSGRATLGMRLFRLQVGRAIDGQRLDGRVALIRWLALGSWLGLLGFTPVLAAPASLLGFVWALVLLVSTVTSPTRQGIHDRIAGSAMVRPAGAGDGLALTCVAILFILPVIAILAIVVLIVMGGQISSILSDLGSSI